MRDFSLVVNAFLQKKETPCPRHLFRKTRPKTTTNGQYGIKIPPLTQLINLYYTNICIRILYFPVDVHNDLTPGFRSLLTVIWGWPSKHSCVHIRAHMYSTELPCAYPRRRDYGCHFDSLSMTSETYFGARFPKVIVVLFSLMAQVGCCFLLSLLFHRKCFCAECSNKCALSEASRNTKSKH